MTDRQALLVQAAALHLLKEQVAAAVEQNRKELLAIMTPGERAPARLADGTRVGAVTISEPGVYASVVDAAAFADWVLANRPGEIVPSVRSSYRDAVLAECKRNYHNGDTAAFTSDGELVPGVRVAPGSPSFRPSYDKEFTAGFADAVRASALLAIEGQTP